MRKIEFTHERTNTHYVRVNRKVALKAFKDNYTLVVFGANDNPLSPWSGMSIWSYAESEFDRQALEYLELDEIKEAHFERLENAFIFYRNKKAWWYLPENIANHYTSK